MNKCGEIFRADDSRARRTFTRSVTVNDLKLIAIGNSRRYTTSFRCAHGSVTTCCARTVIDKIVTPNRKTFAFTASKIHRFPFQSLRALELLRTLNKITIKNAFFHINITVINRLENYCKFLFTRTFTVTTTRITFSWKTQPNLPIITVPRFTFRWHIASAMCIGN
jgi:hypothetical protein